MTNISKEAELQQEGKDYVEKAISSKIVSGVLPKQENS